MAQYVFLHRRTEAFEFIEFRDRIHFACRVGVSIVGADDQTVLAGIVENMRDVVVGLAGDKHVVITKQVLGKFTPGGSIANLDLPIDPRDPRG